MLLLLSFDERKCRTPPCCKVFQVHNRFSLRRTKEENQGIFFSYRFNEVVVIVVVVVVVVAAEGFCDGGDVPAVVVVVVVEVVWSNCFDDCRRDNG